MNWLARLSLKKNSYVVRSAMIVFEDTMDAEMYAEKINWILTNDSCELISEESNWDQSGILTKLITWKEEKEGND